MGRRLQQGAHSRAGGSRITPPTGWYSMQRPGYGCRQPQVIRAMDLIRPRPRRRPISPG